MAGLLSKIGIKDKKKNGDKSSPKENISKKSKNEEISVTKKKKAKVLRNGKEEESQNKEENDRKKIKVAHKVILKLVETEKTSGKKQLGQYCFLVGLKSGKQEIKKAIEEFYNVGVIGVNTLRYKPKKKRRGLITGTRSSFKKAIVTLKEGDSI